MHAPEINTKWLRDNF